MKKLLLFLALAAGSIAGWAEKYPTALYVVGNATEFDWGPGSDPKDAPALTKTSEKVYEGFINFDEANGELKFLVTNKYNQGQWGPNSKGTSITSTEANLYYESIGNDSDGHPDNKFKFNLETGLYLVKVDLATEGSEKVTFKKWESNSVYEIGNLGQLKFFANRLNTDGVSLNAKLIADIGSAEGNKMDYAVGWDDGSSHKWYSGEFNGDGHTIYLNIDKSSDANPNYQGLFGVATNGAKIQDLIIKGSVKGKQYVAGVLGAAKTGHIQMTNVINAAEITATITDNYPDAAGLVGTVNSSTYITLTNCGNAGDIISSRNHCAALCGWSNKSGANKSTYTNCWNIGTISYVQGTGAEGTAAQLYRNSGDDIASSSNCFDASATTERSQGTLLSAGAGASGELCFMLNSKNINTTTWRQVLGTDAYPVPFSSHAEMALQPNGSGWYEISEPWQLNWMAQAVNEKNSTYKNANIKLTADIDYTDYINQAAMFGKPSNTYQGTFDGQYHTVQVAFSNVKGHNPANDDDTDNQTALFRRVHNGTIKNLEVTGTIATDMQFAAGICSGIWDNGSILNCISDVTINDSYPNDGYDKTEGEGKDVKNDATHGGILAYVKNVDGEDNVTVSNCIFTGALNASNRRGCAGVVGWANSEKVHINNCLVTGSLSFLNHGDNGVIVRSTADNVNNYYTVDVSGASFSSIQKYGGTSKSDELLETGELCFLLNGSTSGGTNWTQTIGTDTYPIPFNTSLLVYKNGSDYDNMEKDGDWYKIANAKELDLFSSRVNGGSTTLKAKLTDNITANAAFTPIGDNSHRYTGEFDGNFKSVNLSIDNSTTDFQGLFGAIAGGAYIHDVTVTGSVKGKNYVAGVVASVRGNTGEVNISNCKNTATITGGTNTAGVLGVQYNDGYNTTNMIYCSNTGNITGGSQSALLCGWMGKGSIKYSFASGTINNSTDTNREFSRFETCSFGENGTTTNVTMTGSASTGGAKYFNPNDATYSIGDVETFLTIATMVNVGGLVEKNFTLTSDMNLSDETFVPIGTASYRYKGTFDGGNHKVTLGIDNQSKERQGLFGYATGGAVFQNLIVGGTVNCGANSAALIGEVGGPNQTGTITIRKVGCEATVTGHGNNVGAFIGNDWGASMQLQVENCYNIGDVSVTSGNDYSTVMGFWVPNTSKFINVYNSGTISGGTVHQFVVYSGGTGTQTNCYLSPTSDQVTSGELCAKLGYAFRQNIGSGYPCFEQTKGFVNQISAAGYSTQYNTYSDVTIPDGIEAFAGVKNGTEWLRLVSITGNIAKDEPVILRGNAGLYNFMPTTGISRAASNELSGSNGSVTGGDGIYALAKKSDVVGFYPVESTVTIPEGRAYLNVPVEVKGFTFLFDDDATAIEMVNGQSSMVNDNEIYNLAGQRINKMQKGINIVNGKKIMK